MLSHSFKIGGLVRTHTSDFIIKMLLMYQTFAHISFFLLTKVSEFSEIEMNSEINSFAVSKNDIEAFDQSNK